MQNKKTARIYRILVVIIGFIMLFYVGYIGIKHCIENQFHPALYLMIPILLFFLIKMLNGLEKWVSK